MHSEIIEAAFLHDGEIFGGYVRDLIAGEAPKDIDIKFPTEGKAFQFISYISMNDPITLYHDVRRCKSRQAEWHNKYYGVDVYKLIITNPMERTVLVDVVIGNPWEHADLDVNTLRMNRDGISAGYFQDFHKVIQSITQKKARLLPTCTLGRRCSIARKMKTRGWTIREWAE